MMTRWQKWRQTCFQFLATRKTNQSRIEIFQNSESQQIKPTKANPRFQHPAASTNKHNKQRRTRLKKLTEQRAAFSISKAKRKAKLSRPDKF